MAGWVFFAAALLTINLSIFCESAPRNEDEGVHWALLVAGSSGWGNYRHQADVCHAYQILHKNGIPDERIVVMMYDDLAQNEENPTPGIIINHPNGQDVYQGVIKDYTGSEVTPENFLNVLQGNAEVMQGIGSGKVIKSGPQDHVFVNFVDHGATGLIAFPEGELSADDLNQAILSMYNNKKFAEMVLYIEACEAGSMFEGLLNQTINVYATTAANSDESSYACYYDDQRQTYLGDVYSVMWMEDSDIEDLEQETLHQQFVKVKAETNTSHVTEFGDPDLNNAVLDEFQGGQGPTPLRFRQYRTQKPLAPVPYDAVSAWDVELSILERKWEAALAQGQDTALLAKTNLEKHLEARARIESTYDWIATNLTSDPLHLSEFKNAKYHLTNYACYKPAVDKISKYCFNFSEHNYALKYLRTVANMCQMNLPTARILKSIEKACVKKM